MITYSLYLHIPFCAHRCAYCDFNTYAGQDALIPAYVSALCQELRFSAASASTVLPGRLPVHSVFFGGGTPSRLPQSGFGRILETIVDSYDLLPSCEITVEANPGTLSERLVGGLRSLGVNRLSLGMQSAQIEELRLLERQHTTLDVIRAVYQARKSGFENINLDLIFGLPAQTLESWLATLECALALNPEHFSLYALTLEHGTPMQRWVARGLLSEPDPDLAAEMYEQGAQRLEDAGFVQYEISNWAKRDTSGLVRVCRHNLQYWRLEPYLGFGAGAHGFAAGVHTANLLSPAEYIHKMTGDYATSHKLQEPMPLDSKIPLSFPCTPATVEAQEIDQEAEMGEVMMMGLRLVEEGVSEGRFRARFGQDLRSVFAPAIKQQHAQGLLEWAGEQGDILRLTRRGRLLGNRVFREFV